jgi:hypothetical protein
VFVGRTDGRIVPARGDNQFGWDPVFEPEGFGETYAEMDKGVKNTISHRWGGVGWGRGAEGAGGGEGPSAAHRRLPSGPGRRGAPRRAAAGALS